MMKAVAFCARSAALVWLAACFVSAQDSLTPEQLSMLRDPRGWKYVDIFDLNNGVQEQHNCFAKGEPSPCSGNMKFNKDGTFVQKVFVHGGVAERNGTYELDGNNLTFKDELGTKDGPYQLKINTEKGTMKFSMDQTGVTIGADLALEKPPQKKKTPDSAQPAQPAPQ
jgi:hypothetical protein